MGDVYKIEDLDKFAKKCGMKVDLFCRLTALSGLIGVVKKSPVKTGRFRNSWMVKYNTPDTRTLPKGEYEKSGRIAITRGIGALNIGEGGTRANLFRSKTFKYTSINVSNNLEYGPPLEHGHSKKAPHGMVAVTRQEILAKMEGFAKKVEAL